MYYKDFYDKIFSERIFQPCPRAPSELDQLAEPDLRNQCRGSVSSNCTRPSCKDDRPNDMCCNVTDATGKPRGQCYNPDNKLWGADVF